MGEGLGVRAGGRGWVEELGRRAVGKGWLEGLGEGLGERGGREDISIKASLWPCMPRRAYICTI